MKRGLIFGFFIHPFFFFFVFVALILCVCDCSVFNDEDYFIDGQSQTKEEIVFR